MYDLSDLSNGGDEISVAASDEQRARLAEWAGLNSVESFKAQVTLLRTSATRFAYEAALSADLTQSCVVTLEPVHSHVALDVSRALHLTKTPRGAQLAVHDLSSTADEGPEEIQNSHYDLAGPLLEEFSLAIDPYPRAPGVVFESPHDSDMSESPFAALKRLKKGY
jgi:uncharacterized metal-binding protein YceD (DUF177 family)